METPPPVTFRRAEPQLLVTDLARSLSFFNTKLGFETRFIYGDPPFYAQVTRGDAHLNLRLVADPPIPQSLLQSEEYLAATICVDAIQELFLEWQTKGLDFQHPLHTEPWGSQTFTIHDPDGNLILFAE